MNRRDFLKTLPVLAVAPVPALTPGPELMQAIEVKYYLCCNETLGYRNMVWAWVMDDGIKLQLLSPMFGTDCEARAWLRQNRPVEFSHCKAVTCGQPDQH